MSNPWKVLYDFLVSVLPAVLVAKAIGFAGVVAAVVELAKRLPWIYARRTWAAPLAALVLGQIGGWAAVGFDPQQWAMSLGAGLVITLAAVGGFETVRNITQNRSPDQNKEA